MKFTKRNIDALERPGRDCFIWDDELRGFGLRLSPRGKKTFVVQYRIDRTSQRITLGAFGLLTLEQARKSARILLGEVASGKSPALAQRKKRQSPSLEMVYERFVTEHILLRLKPLTQISYRQVMCTYVLLVLGKRSVIDICRNDVVKLHLDLSYVPTQANRVINVLSKLFTMCEQWDLRPYGSNPCRYLYNSTKKTNAPAF